MDSAKPLVTVAVVAALTLMAAGCGSKTSSSPSASPAPKVVAALDTTTLAGKWEGYAHPTSGAAVPIEVDVRPDGTYVSRMGATSGTGAFRIVDGKVVADGHLSGSAFADAGRSTAVVKQRNGRMVLSGNGRNDAGPYSYELTKRQ